MKSKVLEILENFKKKREIAWENYRAVCKEESDAVANVLDFTGKYIKINDTVDNGYIYLKVTKQVQCPYYGTEKPGLTLYGIGFSNPTSDRSVWFLLDSDYSYSIDLTEISEELDKIQEITEAEFKYHYFKMQTAAGERLMEML